MQIVEDSDATAFGLDATTRLTRQLARLDAQPAEADAEAALRGDRVYDASVLRALLAAPEGTWLVDAEALPVAVRFAPEGAEAATRALAEGVLPPGAAPTTAEALAGGYDPKLRRRNAPFVLRAEDPRVEQALFDASYKGVTDAVTKHVWPPLALPVTRWCARASVTPNQVTVASGVLVLVAFWLFWIGAFGWGLAAAWAMTFLDTVDGKLARTTLSASRFGDVLDHGIDLVHPPFWWWAWAAGCAAAGDPLGDGGAAVAVIVAGYVLQRGEEGLFIARFGIEMHVWRRFDSLFRQITARRNPNLVILTAAALLGAPREGLIAVAAWTALCFGVHALRIGQAFLAARRGPLVPWMAQA
ncbi:Phosphatidylglycerophosphate synthase [Albimonas pacifica]|uniref:Phosphatidylglycerophosphate synthase n=1 Tax=Albimonas pacifica TaxID=1114924 RepID=A0A1I3BQ69_9RHOB|nr:Phosphatidylglycerophosphate synthase [Albimonas pacifica]